MADQAWKDRHLPSDRMRGIRKAAVAFANDYGPLPAANAGDEDAQQAIAERLIECLERQGLVVERARL